MKKLYFLLFALLTVSFSFSQVTITRVVDGGLPSDGCAGASGASSPKAIELYVNGTVDFTNYTYDLYSNGGTTPNSESLADLGMVTDSFVYIITLGETTFDEIVSSATKHIGGGSFNGDDTITITSDGTTIVDQFGEIGVDGSGMAWEYLDSYAKRNDGDGPNTTFTLSEWTFGGPNVLDGVDCPTLSAAVGFGSYSGTVTTDPTLTIVSPIDGVVLPSGTTSIDISIVVQNFVVANGTGDGHIHWTVDGTPQAMKYDTNDETVSGLMDGGSYVVYMELVDNSHTPIVPAVNATVNFSVAYPCDLQIGTITTMCDAETPGVDTYTTTLEFTGGGTSTYTIDTEGMGTVMGDDPSSVASGTITITGVNEGTNFAVTFTGDAGNSSCDFTRNINAPTCLPLPIYEPFDYTNGNSLISQSSNWSNVSDSSDEVMVNMGNLSYSGLPTSLGAMVAFDGAGSDPGLSFSPVSSGDIYASFIFSVSNQSLMTDLTDGGYFAILNSSGFNFDARLWVRPNPDAAGTTFDIGFGDASSNPPFSANTYDVGTAIFIVMSYNIDTGNYSLWINPNSTDFGGSAPTATMTGTDASPASSISQFIIRQDSTGETPGIFMDELRLGTSWADVTPSILSTGNFDAKSFTVFPNPTSTGIVNIISTNNTPMQVKVYDILGKQVKNETITSTLNVSGLKSGIYILNITQEGHTVTKKLVVE